MEELVKRFEKLGLEEHLKGRRRVPEFMYNIRHLLITWRKPYFARYCMRLFGWRIREGLVFAQSLIDIAVKLECSELDALLTKRSYHGLERLLYRPYGLASRHLRVPNVYSVGGDWARRLVGVRVMELLEPYERYEVSVRRICRTLSMFGHGSGVVIRTIEELLARGLVVVATKETRKLGNLRDCGRELIKLTEIGFGVERLMTHMNYIEAGMYDVEVEPGRFASCAGGDDVDLFRFLRTLRVFLKETADIELAELKCVADKDRIGEYDRHYGSTTTVTRFYEGVITAVVWVGLAEKKRGYRTFSGVLNLAQDMEREFDAHRRDVQVVCGFYPGESPSAEYLRAVGRLRIELANGAKAGVSERKTGGGI
jgi:hypothetical protein